jgi:outer membrane protein assembly factor BamB
MFKEIAANWDSESIAGYYGWCVFWFNGQLQSYLINQGQRTWGTEVGTTLCCTIEIRKMSKVAVSDWISEYGG